MKIVFDMDGTIADLYGVDDWLDYIYEEDTSPYREADAMIDTDRLVKVLTQCKKLGYEIEIVSWLARGGSPAYGKRVRSAKVAWLNRILPNCFTAIHIVKWGTDKSKYCNDFEDILFDDEEANRTNWLGRAYTPEEIFEVLENLIKE